MTSFPRLSGFKCSSPLCNMIQLKAKEKLVLKMLLTLSVIESGAFGSNSRCNIKSNI